MEGVYWMRKESYQTNIERQNIIQKISLIYAVMYNKRLSRSNGTLKNAKGLFEMRNPFIHPRTHSSKLCIPTDQPWKKVEKYSPTSLKSVVKTVNGLITKDPSWLSNIMLCVTKKLLSGQYTPLSLI